MVKDVKNGECFRADHLLKGEHGLLLVFQHCVNSRWICIINGTLQTGGATAARHLFWVLLLCLRGGWKWLDQQKSRRAYKVIQPLESETLELYQELVMDWGRFPKGFLFAQITQKCVIFINRGTSNCMRNKNKTSMFSWSFLVCSTFSHMVSFLYFTYCLLSLLQLTKTSQLSWVHIPELWHCTM